MEMGDPHVTIGFNANQQIFKGSNRNPTIETVDLNIKNWDLTVQNGRVNQC